MEKLPRVNLSEIIADKIHQDILEGKLKPGDRLPPHEVLCERWGVSRVTLREALKTLDTKGLIEIHQGRGTFVRNYNRDLIESQFEFHSLLGEKTILQLFEARKIIETALVELATRRITKSEIASLDSILKDMVETVKEGDPLQFARFDFNFHNSIGGMAKNDVLLMMLEKIQFLIETQQREMFEYAHEPNPLESSFHDHKEICRMIRERNAPGAARKMYEHIQHMENRVQSYYKDKHAIAEAESEAMV
ncbi:MAG: FadR family transcriptional regulator [Spirochaetaceae bacterium]|nr:MAG: FadR family transcriptional regulator [Spirochaetaceae bacterium]